MGELEFEAEFHRYCLVAGLVSRSEVVRWADARLVELDDPPAELIDVSLGTRLPLAELERSLRAIPGPERSPRALTAALGHARHLLEAGSVDACSLVAGLRNLCCTSGVPDEVSHQLDGLDDALHLAITGTYGTLQTVEDDLKAALSRFEEFPGVEPASPGRRQAE